VRPNITQYTDPVRFVGEMIQFRKLSEPGFSVHSEAKSLRKVSPTLVSLVLKRKRKLTPDRADEFAKLLDLNASEKNYFRHWIGRMDAGPSTSAAIAAPLVSKNRKDVSTHILNDWLNVYVKDCFQLPEVRKNPAVLNQMLGHLVPAKRVSKAVEFLLREGHLRRTLEGEIVPEVNLAVADPKISSKKIRQFHKAALGIAKQAIDIHTPSERIANTLVIPLNEKSYAQLQRLIEEFGEKVKDFASENEEAGERLYQFVLNVSPVGGKTK
jgi:uncharacterized protein (TIGR02147 family)